MVYAVHRKPKRLQLPFPLYLQRAWVFSWSFQFHKDWQDIAYSMHCTESNVFKVHSKALQAVKLPKLGSEFQ